MDTTIARKENMLLKTLIREVRDIKRCLKTMAIIIPEESIKEYTNQKEIRKAYHNAIKQHPPRT